VKEENAMNTHMSGHRLTAPGSSPRHALPAKPLDPWVRALAEERERVLAEIAELLRSQPLTS
jgi:hypothetical protein